MQRHQLNRREVITTGSALAATLLGMLSLAVLLTALGGLT